ncbi:2-aminoadipate aminotransferase [Azoarcus sp. DD4]|nr:2-aminoadipate aminotransferase [Azoarcus sp. DD4]
MVPMDLSTPLAPPAATQPLYRQLAAGYRAAIENGTLRPGDRMPSVRALMQRHAVSLSTALQLCRHLEDGGWLEARPRSGYFVRRKLRTVLPAAEPDAAGTPDPAAFVGIHATVSAIVAQGLRYPDALNLGGASATPALYPTEALKNAALRALRHQPELLTTPGSPNGNPDFRAVLARRALDAGIRVTADELIVTHGGIEAVNLALRAVAQPGDTVAVESPTFFGLLQVLESLGMRALEIPTSPSSGISVEALELALRSYGGIKAVVVVPNLQNPLGAIMPDSRKAVLVALCEQHDIALIEDDPYRDMHSRATPPKALKAWDRSGGVIHCASLNKTLAPGMRLGWMAAGRWQARVAMLKFAQSRHNEEWSQLAAAEFMATSAYDRHLQRLREHLSEQRERMADTIAASFPAGTRLSLPDGGVMLWIELPGQLSSRRLFDAALTAGIRIAPGAMFSNSGRFDHFIRLGCGQPYTPELDAALRRLGGIASALLAEAP